MKYADAWEDLKEHLETERQSADSATADSEFGSRVYYTNRSKLITIKLIEAYIEHLEGEYE